MKKLFHLRLAGLFLAAGVLVLTIGCGGAGATGDTTPVPQVTATPTEEELYIIGKWEVNDGRFGHKIFDFQEDGRLLLEDVDSGEMIEMRYEFVEQNTIILSGNEAYNGSATIQFYGDKFDLTISFEGTIFGELYVFTRVDEAAN